MNPVYGFRAPKGFENPPDFQAGDPVVPPRDPYRDLADAVILFSVFEYRRALRSLRRRPRNGKARERMEEVEAFFRSRWFGVLTDLDGEMLIRRLREEGKTRRR